jgi:hypothetical protein
MKSLLSIPGTWLISMGQTRGLVFAFAVAALLEATFIPLMIDLLMFTFFITGTVALWRLVLAGALASIVGTSLFWVLGLYGGEASLVSLFSMFDISPTAQQSLLTQWNTNWIGTTWIAGLTAIPDPAVAYLAGSTGIPVYKFIPVLSGVLLLRFATMGGIVWLISKVFKFKSQKAKTAMAGFSFLATLIFTAVGLGVFFLT